MSALVKAIVFGLAVAALFAAVLVGVRLRRLRSTIAIPPSDVQVSLPSAGADEWREAITEARQILVPLFARYPGMSIAVGREGSIVWSEAFGFSDLEAGTRATPETRFRAYSVAKSITAAAVLRLRQDGRLDVDAPVGRYLTSLPADVGGVTIRQLAGHVSGIRAYEKGELPRGTPGCSSPFDALGTFVNDPLDAPPGSRYTYSSFNYLVLSALIETTSGESFDGYMRNSILVPAGMHATMLGTVLETGSSVSAFYKSAWRGRVRPAPPVDNSCAFGAGALLTTSEDLVQFGNAFLGGGLLSPENVDVALTSMTTTDGETTGYAFGWEVGVDSTGTRVALHNGAGTGGRSVLCLFPDTQTVVAVLTNMAYERLDGVAQEIGRAFGARARTASQRP